MASNAKIEKVLTAYEVSCRQCTHAKEPTTIMPTCTRYRLQALHWSTLQRVEFSRFCYDVRLDERACGWRAAGFEAKPQSVRVFLGSKFTDRDD